MKSSFATITIALFSAAFAITAIVALVWGAVTNEEVSSAAPLVGLVVVYNNGEAVNGIVLQGYAREPSNWRAMAQRFLNG